MVQCGECVILSCGGGYNLGASCSSISEVYNTRGSSSAVEVEMDMVEFCARLAFAELRASADRHVFWFFPASSAAKTDNSGSRGLPMPRLRYVSKS